MPAIGSDSHVDMMIASMLAIISVINVMYSSCERSIEIVDCTGYSGAIMYRMVLSERLPRYVAYTSLEASLPLSAIVRETVPSELSSSFSLALDISNRYLDESSGAKPPLPYSDVEVLVSSLM